MSLAQQGNVFYPEGVLKVVRDHILGTTETEVWSQPRRQATVDAGLSLLKTLLPTITDGDSRSCFLDEQCYQQLRSAWLHAFFEQHALQPESWDWFRFGLILSPRARVMLSYHHEYPAQATIEGMRILPKEVVGMLFTPRRIEDFKNKRFELSEDDVLVEAFDQWLTFPLFAKKLGVSTTRYESWWKAMRDASRRQAQENNDAYREKRDEVQFDRHAIMREILGDDEYREAERIASAFFKEYAPVESGESYWTGILRIAEKYQVPVYNTRGDLLWPKELPHEQLVEEIDKRNVGAS